MYDWLSEVCEITAILLLLHQCFGKTKFRDFFNIYNMLYVVFHLIAWYVILELGYQSYHIFILYIILLIFAWFYFREKCMKIFVSMIAMLAVISMLQLIWSIPITYFIESDMLRVFLINLLTLFSIILLIRYISFHEVLETLHMRRAIIYILGMGLFLISEHIFMNYIFYHKVTLKGALFGMAVEGFFCYLAYEWNRMERRLVSAEKDLRLYEEYNVLFYERQKDLRRRQHDYDNHLSAIYSMCYTTKNYEQLVEKQKAYMEEVIYDNRFNKLLCQGECPVITAFIYTKFSEAEAKGIRIQYKIRVKDLGCAWSIYDMVTVLGNLLDNAFCGAILTGQKEIVFAMDEYPDKIEISISNPMPDDVHKGLNGIFKEDYSTKGEGYGYGLPHVRKLVLQHNDIISVEVHDEEEKPWITFRITIIKK